MTRLRAAIVGLDHYHTTGWVESLELFAERIEIVAIYDPEPTIAQTLAPSFFDPHLRPALHERYRELPFFSDLGELIARQSPELALVTLPNVNAPAAISQLAGAGVHLLVDKPGASNATAAHEAFAIAKQHRVKVATGLLRRYGRGWQHAKSLIESGRSGRVLATEAVFNTSSPFIRGPENPLFSHEMQGGGILLWLGIHDIDQLLWLTGERIVEVQAMSGQVNGAGIDVEDVVSLSLKYESGAIGSVHYGYVLPRPMSEGHLAIRGASGSVSVAFDGTVRWVGAGTAGDPVVEETLTYTTRAVPGYGPMAPAVIKDLLQAIEGDYQPRATGEDLVNALRVIDAAYESAATGKRVTVQW